MSMRKDEPWWLHNNCTSRRSSWLQSTIAELNEKTNAILKLIEEDADSFAQRAEMYYKKRPQLISMLQHLYRTHRSLAERYDQLKFTSPRCQSHNSLAFTDRNYDSYSEICDVEESVDSEIDDSDLELEQAATTNFTKQCDEIERLREEIRTYKDQLKQKDGLSDQVSILKGEIEGLREENVAYKDQLKEKDEEKMEVIRQLSLAIDILKQENVKMRDFIAKRWRNPFQFRQLKRALSQKLFNASQGTSLV
ncbi:protein NETWORKED 3A-like [Senna tora]|uniref:Protein NETWORKED 3A-like n=1 Tax=Senna tora TaxID=362788 RepID=A0A834TB83_9FABA|nr:protein NETWORKED 3A-like [Senna tora]